VQTLRSRNVLRVRRAQAARALFSVCSAAATSGLCASASVSKSPAVASASGSGGTSSTSQSRGRPARSLNSTFMSEMASSSDPTHDGHRRSAPGIQHLQLQHRACSTPCEPRPDALLRPQCAVPPPACAVPPTRGRSKLLHFQRNLVLGPVCIVRATLDPP